LGHVHQALALVETDVERAEAGARALGIGVAADHELLAPLALDLEPVGRSPRLIRARKLLGHDALEAQLRRRLEERRALLQDEVAALHRSDRRHGAREQLLAPLERELA